MNELHISHGHQLRRRWLHSHRWPLRHRPVRSYTVDHIRRRLTRRTTPAWIAGLCAQTLGAVGAARAGSLEPLVEYTVAEAGPAEFAITDDDVERFYDRWAQYDPLATQFVAHDYLLPLVAGLRAVLQAERHQKGSLTQSVQELKQSVLQEREQRSGLADKVRTAR